MGRKQVGSLLVAAMFGAGARAQVPEPPAQPITLVTQTEGSTVLLRVIGESDTAVAAEYALEVTSGAAPGGNRSTQRGSVRLTPGAPVVLLTQRLGGSAAGNWRANLRVTLGAGDSYVVERTGG